MQEKIRFLFETFKRLGKFKTVAEHLNAEGCRTANGSWFTGQYVARMLCDQTYLENRTVSQDLWDEVQSILAARRRGGNAKCRVAHLCSGLLRCGCGQMMYVPTNSKKYTCSKCRNKITKDDLEMIVLEKLKLSGNEKIKATVQNWKNHSFEEQREIIESTVQEIIAEDKKVTLTLFVFG